jgi:esterase/lipase
MTREVARNLYSAIPHSDKKLVFFEGADHGGAFDSAPEKYVKCIVDFLSAGLHN